MLAGLSPPWSETPKTDFLVTRLKLKQYFQRKTNVPTTPPVSGVLTGLHIIFFCPCDLENRANHFSPLSNWCFHASLTRIHLSVIKMECRQGSFWHLKIGPMSPKTNQVFTCGNLKTHIHSNDKAVFGQNDILRAYVTLKMGSMSPKPNHFLLLSIWCSHASLVRIQQLVLKTQCRQGSFLLSKPLKIGSKSPKFNYFTHPNYTLDQG